MTDLRSTRQVRADLDKMVCDNCGHAYSKHKLPGKEPTKNCDHPGCRCPGFHHTVPAAQVDWS